ncbi:MAG: nuclear transport factor 2 family protein [Nitrolancea sp.]
MEPVPANPVEIVRSAIAALNRGDIDAVLGLCSDDVTLWAPGPDLVGQQVTGKDELQELLEYSEGRWPDTWTSIDSITGEGDLVAVEMTTVASQEGVSIVQPMAAFYRVRDGLIVEQRSYYDLRALEHRLNG